jgi:alpha-amylase/alpha-mannosidase (GH57 family)
MNIEVAFLWHFHQPVYSKPDDPVLPMPWVRLHAIKDYLDMLKNMQQFPGIRATFNFTPALLVQLRDYMTGKCTDRQFVLFQKRAEDLALEERIEILRDFFLANWSRMVEPYPRYFSLLMKRGRNIVEDELPAVALNFTADEIRDLQIWSNLAWIDPMFRSEIGDLYKQGKNFREQDKERVIGLEQKIMGSIFSEYRKAWESGQIEIITSPMYHPIMPLLVNSGLAKRSNPGLAIPFEFSHPEDARAQLEKGIECFAQIFGRRPAGVWPSEGSVCEEVMVIAAELGIEWLATDEEILARSINVSFNRDETCVPDHAAALYKPWKYGKVKMIFRDHVISDRIAFVYNMMDHQDAARDFARKIRQISSALPQQEKFIIPIILDGENAWEYFEDDGARFLHALYQTISDEKIPTTTVTDYLHRHDAANILDTLFPGSWIGANFNIWMGKPEDHRAWMIVKDIRDKLVARKITDPDVWDRLYVIEGSDWFWWFGDDFFSVTTEVFDQLFRSNVIWLYRKIGEEPPHELFSSINPNKEIIVTQPVDRLTPVIDGKLTFFYEWYNAGCTSVKRTGGTMHRFAGLFSTIYYGFDSERLYIRFDITDHDIRAYQYELDFYKPVSRKLVLDHAEDFQHAILEIGEIAVPFSLLDLGEERLVEFVLRAREKGLEVDRTPLLKVAVTKKGILLNNWTA